MADLPLTRKLSDIDITGSSTGMNSSYSFVLSINTVFNLQHEICLSSHSISVFSNLSKLVEVNKSFENILRVSQKVLLHPINLYSVFMKRFASVNNWIYGLDYVDDDMFT